MGMSIYYVPADPHDGAQEACNEIQGRETFRHPACSQNSRFWIESDVKAKDIPEKLQEVKEKRFDGPESFQKRVELIADAEGRQNEATKKKKGAVPVPEPDFAPEPDEPEIMEVGFF